MILWITPTIGTCSFYALPGGAAPRGCTLLDVRELLDREGNDPKILSDVLSRGAAVVRSGGRLVVCCDMGISRSNAVALGVWLATGQTNYSDALARLAHLGKREMNLGLLRDLRQVLEGSRLLGSGSRPRVLVTGASGLIGKTVMRELGERFSLFAASRADFDLHRDLLRLDEFAAAHSIEAVLHLAHPRERNNVAAVGESVGMTKTMLELARLNGLRFVFVSSLAVFSGYDGPETTVISRQISPRPRGAFGEAKYLCEQLISHYREHQGVRAAVLRTTFVYGADLAPSHFLAKFIARARAGEPLRTHRYRNGPPEFDLLHVRDLARAVGAALEMMPEPAVNVGTGVHVSSPDLAARIKSTLNSPSRLEELELADTTPRTSIDLEAARRALNWSPGIDLAAGLGELCALPAPEFAGRLAACA